MKTRQSICLISLGCPKNLVDSEGLMGTLLAQGFQVLREPEEADLVLVNTCGFLEISRQESLQVIREAVAKKKTHQVKGVLVAGCMAGNYRDLIQQEVPGVDLVVPFQDYPSIGRLAASLLPPASPPTFMAARRKQSVSLTPGHFSYLKISEGCNHRCAFCVIPSIRGAMRSLPQAEILGRARSLALRGVKELCLIAQDSTVYGADLHGRPELPDLLRNLDQVEGIQWVRLMYAYPTEVDQELVEVLAGGEHLLPYLDVPVQHAADRVLKRMRRGYGRRRLEQMLALLRGAHPSLALRTTVIVGFPGETEEEFQELLDFIHEARFDRLGAFVYSREPGSSADALDGHLPPELKQERYERLMSAQQEIAFLDAASLVGSRQQVLVDAGSNGSPAQGRTFRDAPEIDPVVTIRDAAPKPGELLWVEITASQGYDLLAHPLQDICPPL